MSAIKQNKITPFHSQPHSSKNSRENSAEKLPVHQSLSKNGNSNIRPSAFPNPYLKKFNLRKIHRTEESSKKRVKVDEEQRENDHSVVRKLNDTMEIRKNKRFNSIRVHT